MATLSKKLQTGYHVLKGDYRASEFALTNVCVARCSFCKIWEQQPKVIVRKDDALKVIDKLASLSVKQIVLTGGEALIQPNIVEIVKRCTDHNMVSGIPVADPRLLTPSKCAMLSGAGLDYVFISIDHHTEELEFQARKIPLMFQHIKAAVENVKSAGIKVAASTLISKFNYRSMRQLYDKCNDLEFDLIGLNYPETSLSPVYQLGGEAVNLTREEIVYGLEEVISLKKTGYNILNPLDCLENAVSYLRTGKGTYDCWGGNKVMFVDWFLDLYPCMHMAKPLGPVLNITKSDLYKEKCNACGMSWYRDLSIYLQGFKSIAPITRVIKDSLIK